MALTQNTYTGDGSTVLFSFTFPYLTTTDIKVSVNGVDTTAYSLANATTIQFSSAPSNGAAIRIFRDTNVDSLNAEFFSGSAIRASDLNNDFNQILYSTQETVNRRVESTGGDMTGDLTMVNADIVFEGSTNDANETKLSAVDPTADRTILLPNVSGTVVTTGDTGTVSTGMVADSAITSAKIANGTIVDADIASNAELSVSKLQDGSARQLLQTSANGNDVEWASNIDIPGTLDVAGSTTLDSGVSVTGNITVSGTVDGRDVAADGTKLDSIESGATADQTAAEIRTLVESASDSNVFTNADHTKLNAIEAGATADQTAAEIRTLVDNATNSNVYIDSHHAILDGATLNTSELNTLDGITASTAEINQLDGKSISGTLTPANSNDIPTSSAVNTFVSGLLNALGGFVAIGNENSFPTTNPDPSDDAGTVVSISDAGGMSVNSSGVATGQTTAGTTVTITGFPSSLSSTTLGAGLGLQVQTTNTLNTYTYHKLIAKEADVKQLSDDINDFQARYRVSDNAPTTDLDEGDLWYDKTANKMKVYDTSTSAWKEVQSVGNFFINSLSSSSATGGGSATFNGSAYRFTLSNAPQNAQQLLVSVNGVIQKPNAGTSQPSEGFAIDTNDIIFAAAPATGSDFFIITVGSTVNIGTPSNNTVNASHIIDGSITNAKVSSSAAIAGTKISPNFGSQNVVTTGSAGIGTTSPARGPLHINSSTAETYFHVTNSTTGSSASDGFTLHQSGNETLLNNRESGNMRFYTAGSERMRIDSSGRLLVGGSSAISGSSTNDNLQLINSAGSILSIASSDTTIGNGTRIGEIEFWGQPGSTWGHFASITVKGDASAAANDNPGRIQFSTTADGATTPTERMRIDSSGRLLVGTTSSGIPGGDELTIATSGHTGMTIRAGTSSRSSIYMSDGTGGNSEYRGYIEYDHGSDYMRFGSAAAERVRIDSSGNVGIGVSSPRGLLHLHSSSAPRLDFTNATTGTASTDGTTISVDSSTGALNIIQRESQPIQFYTNNTEKARIDTDGHLQIRREGVSSMPGVDTRHTRYIIKQTNGQEAILGAVYAQGQSAWGGDLVFASKSATGNPATGLAERMRIGDSGYVATHMSSTLGLVLGTVGNATNYTIIKGRSSSTGINTGNDVFYVYGNGNVQNSNNSYGQISDQKLKENIVDANSQWNNIKDVRVRNFNFIEGQTHTQIGVVAQELEAVSPGLIDEAPDRDKDGNDLGTVTKSVKYSVLYMKAVKALQEAMERIETLETQNASLEARLTALEGGS